MNTTVMNPSYVVPTNEIVPAADSQLSSALKKTIDKYGNVCYANGFTNGCLVGFSMATVFVSMVLLDRPLFRRF